MVANKSSSPSRTRKGHKSVRDKRTLLPAREVHRRLKDALSELQRAERNAVLWFAEVVRRKLYKELGYSSIHQYAEVELGFGMSKTSQFLRLVESLEHLPKLRRALARGEIPWTTAREVATVATPKTEAQWIAESKQVPRRVLETRTAETRRLARAGASGSSQVALGVGASGAISQLPGKVEGTESTTTAKPRTSAVVDPGTPVGVSLRMTAEQFARYQALLETLRKQGAGSDAVDLILASLEQAAVAREGREKHAEAAPAKGRSRDCNEKLSNSGAGSESDFPRGKYRRSPYQVIVHQCPSCERATVPTNRGEKAITPQELRTILCDARKRNSGGRNKTPIPERLRRAVMERDRHRCRATGCGRTSFLAVHHKIPREDGGKNAMENLITLCSGCHRALHAHE